MVTMKTVADYAGVSTATVSRVLNGKGEISGATIDRVSQAMKELGYRPNNIARSLRTVSTRTLGTLVSNVANPFFAGLVRGIEDRSAEVGFGLLLGNADEQVSRQQTYLDAFLEKRVDGLIITPTGTEVDWVFDLQARELPLVFIDRTLPGIDIPSVTTDHQDALRQLTSHLIEQGHRSLGLLTGPAANAPIQRRVHDIARLSRESGLSLTNDHILEGGTVADDGRRAMERFLASGQPLPDVLFALNNSMALGALQALSAAGIRIPQDIAFVSFDDSPWFEVIRPSITAVSQPVLDMAHTAVDLIARLISGEHVESVQLPAGLIVRESTMARGN